MLCTTHKSCKSQFYIDDKIMSSHSSAWFSIINTADEPINSNTRGRTSSVHPFRYIL